MKSKKQSLLWQIQHPGQSQLSYVFGTMHISEEVVFKPMDFLKEKIQNCHAFGVEYDLEEGQKNIPKDIIYLPEDKKINNFITPKKYQRLRKSILKSFHVDLDYFARLQPLFINNAINDQVLPDNKKLAMDAYLWNFAKQENKQLLGIETWEEQLETLAKLTIEYQLKGLLDLGRKPENYRKTIQKSIKDYLDGDFDKLYQSAKKSCGKKRKVLLFNRNKVMAKRIFDYSEQSSLFAAIGAGHLGGGKGVLRLLKKMDLSVKPMTFPKN